MEENNSYVIFLSVNKSEEMEIGYLKFWVFIRGEKRGLNLRGERIVWGRWIGVGNEVVVSTLGRNMEINVGNLESV